LSLCYYTNWTVSGTVEAKASLERQVLEPEEWPSSSLMGDIDAPIDDAVGCQQRAAMPSK